MSGSPGPASDVAEDEVPLQQEPNAQGGEAAEDVQSSYKQHELSFSEKPALVAYAAAETASRQHNFFRSAKWCPDGSCVLTQEEDRLTKIFSLPQELVEVSCTTFCLPMTSARLTAPSARAIQLKPYLSLPTSPAALIGLEWYPFASSTRPETFCFVRSCRDVPVALIDGNTGKTRASYVIMDHQERFIGPQSMTFSLDGTKLYCGFESAIECFNIQTPGNESTRFHTSPSRKSKTGQKGLISSISFSPDGSGVMAAGSYSRSVWLYDTSGGEPRAIRSLKMRDYAGSGVTQVKFHPTAPEVLYTASRCTNEILVWDIRDTRAPTMVYKRPGYTNQRIAFDIDVWGRWLTTGDTDGYVHFFDTQDLESSEAAHSYKLANDAISMAALHPYLPYLLTSSGSRRFNAATSGSESDESSSDERSDSDTNSEHGDEPRVTALQRGINISGNSSSSMPTAAPATFNSLRNSCVSLWKLS